MKKIPGNIFTLAIAFLASATCMAETVQLGTIKFVANTNVKMFKFTGEVKDLTSTVTRTKGAISAFELHIPVKSIKTGMDVRDKHMNERIFEDANKTLPDLVYQASKVDCQPAAPASPQTCQVTGNLTMRGETKPLPLTLTLNNDKDVSGSAVIDVLQFGVKPEVLKYSQIKVDNNVSLNFEVKLQ